MQKQQLFDLHEGDCIYVYSGGKLEAQGRYVSVVEDKNESFLCWRKYNGNEVYTNLNGISVETINENTAYLQNTKETCERGYVNNYNQNTGSTYEQGHNNYDQNSSSMNASGMYDQSYNNYDENMDNTYQSSYDNSNQICRCTCNHGYNMNYSK
ncbi:hypothetical protein EXW59_01280 (plasmid) [Bacillus mycoides]|uniref:hypothetical protein n=1 Tax=Bacillus mycoides TaxID=1405 RepID=UPI001C02004E|nr:hypothetical protein [Bacillus mycoides]QWH75521.1 hypothetical protein EXW59_01280 [Bacillus mycoides]